ncbi:lipocalin family protein [Psychroserpens sp. XS_ASV72]|uniref:lipocalin family protein n=1 Tax=Psychroserpens sp. XS_ASV72 TaxID=3241293 RepID=UPI003518A4EF
MKNFIRNAICFLFFILLFTCSDSDDESNPDNFNFELIEQMFNTNNEAVTQLNEFLSENDLETSLIELKSWLENSPDIVEADISSGNVEIKYSFGKSSFVVIAVVDENGNRTKGGGLQTLKKYQSKKTQYTNNQNIRAFNNPNQISFRSGEHLIENRKVFIYDPFDSAFLTEEGSAIQSIFASSDLGFDVTLLRNQECTISSLNNLTDYGFIYISSHGENGDIFWTRESVILPNGDNMDELSDILQLVDNNQIVMETLVEYKVFVTPEVTELKGTFWGVNSNFIQNLNGNFPNNSVVFNSSCESAKTSSLAEAFNNKNAGTYIGFDKKVWEDFAKQTGVEYVQNLLTPENTSIDAFNLITIPMDNRVPYDATVLHGGNQDVTYHSDVETNPSSIIGTWLLTGETENGVNIFDPSDCDVVVTFGATQLTSTEYWGDNCENADSSTSNYTINGNTLIETNEGESSSSQILELSSTTLRLTFTDGDFTYVETYTRQ